MSGFARKKLCCTCLSADRKLRQLCKIIDGINLLYMLLSLDPEAYKQGFYREASSLLVCWECVAVINKINMFRKQACTAQKLLTTYDEERNMNLQTLSQLRIIQNVLPQYEFTCSLANEDNFIDCGPTVKEIKSESEDDLPLSLYIHDNSYDYNQSEDTINSVNCMPSKDCNNCNIEQGNCGEIDNDLISQRYETAIVAKSCSKQEFAKKNLKEIYRIDSSKLIENITVVSKESNTENDNIITSIQQEKCNKKSGHTIHSNLCDKASSKNKTKMKYTKYFNINTMTEEEMLKSVEKRKIDLEECAFKCDKCCIGFKNENEVLKHKERLHVKQDSLSECHICHSYIEDLPAHIQSHYTVYGCVLCSHTTNTHTDMIRHLKRNHGEVHCRNKKGSKGTEDIAFEGRTYPCPECDLSFHNKDLRWKHVQKTHREGFACNTCHKKFAFKNNLERHERIHGGPMPREECPTCHKMIRIDLMKVHRRTHTDRQTHVCVECDKQFVSLASYRGHLKYARAHAPLDKVARHACDVCGKRYRSRGELQDHVNYQHKGQATHKCPVCGKGLATKRCIRRHVRRAHEGIKESARDKVCQLCGKAFRDKKSLTEHERVHTGARPLPCAVCGRAFRQRAALHKHQARLHTNKHI